MFSLMGNCMSWMKRRREPNRKLILAILGLDNAGKTVTTKGLQGEGPETVAPTVGFSSADFKLNKFDITLYDLGGGKKIRGIWKNYYAEIYGVIYVLDSSDSDRLEEAKQTLWDLLEQPRMKGKPLLVLANKQDKEGALDEIDLCERLNLENMVNHFKCPCRVETCSALLGYGKKLDKSIKQGLSWLLSTISNEWETLDERVKTDVAEQEKIDAQEKKERIERVRKIREERERQAERERELNGDVADNQEDEDDLVMGDPFKRLDAKAMAEKEFKSKEKKKKINKKNKKYSDDDNDEDDATPAQRRPRTRSLGDRDEPNTDIFTPRSARAFSRTTRAISDNEEEGLAAFNARNPLDRSPLPGPNVRYLRDGLSSQDRFLRKKSLEAESGELSLTPRPRLAPLPLPRISGGRSNRGYHKDQDDDDNDDDDTVMPQQPRFSHHHQHHKPSLHHAAIQEEHSEDEEEERVPYASPRLSKRHAARPHSPLQPSTPHNAYDEDDDVMIGAPPRRVLQPLDGSDHMELESEKRKKKKKRLRRRVAPMSVAENESAMNSMEDVYPSPRQRHPNPLNDTQTFSPRLEPLQLGRSSQSQDFSRKWGLLDELPDLPDPRSSRSAGPNTDYDQDIIT